MSNSARGYYGQSTYHLPPQQLWAATDVVQRLPPEHQFHLGQYDNSTIEDKYRRYKASLGDRNYRPKKMYQFLLFIVKTGPSYQLLVTLWDDLVAFKLINGPLRQKITVHTLGDLVHLQA